MSTISCPNRCGFYDDGPHIGCPNCPGVCHWCGASTTPMHHRWTSCNTCPGFKYRYAVVCKKCDDRFGEAPPHAIIKCMDAKDGPGTMTIPTSTNTTWTFPKVDAPPIRLERPSPEEALQMLREMDPKSRKLVPYLFSAAFPDPETAEWRYNSNRV
jgi:hypothetical protein